VERSLLGAATLVAAAWCRAGMRPEAGPRGKSAECSDHGQSGGRTGVVISRTLLAGCRPPPAGPPERSDPGRVYTELTIVRQWLYFAVSRRMLTASPVAGTKLVKPKPGPRDYWRQEQLDAIVQAARDPYKAAFLSLTMAHR
jgi:hypothetical protein